MCYIPFIVAVTNIDDTTTSRAGDYCPHHLRGHESMTLGLSAAFPSLFPLAPNLWNTAHIHSWFLLPRKPLTDTAKLFL